MKQDKPLKYIGYSIVMQEVPDEISLGFNISGCEHHCKNCHSKFLWEYEGDILKENFNKIYNQYKIFITCVCFFGGEQNAQDLLNCCEQAHKDNIKVCLYTGVEKMCNLPPQILDNFDYIKTGKYVESLGGLDHKTTNQRLYKKVNGKFIDITEKFWETKTTRGE